MLLNPEISHLIETKVTKSTQQEQETQHELIFDASYSPGYVDLGCQLIGILAIFCISFVGISDPTKIKESEAKNFWAMVMVMSSSIIYYVFIIGYHSLPEKFKIEPFASLFCICVWIGSLCFIIYELKEEQKLNEKTKLKMAKKGLVKALVIRRGLIVWILIYWRVIAMFIFHVPSSIGFWLFCYSLFEIISFMIDIQLVFGIPKQIRASYYIKALWSSGNKGF